MPAAAETSAPPNANPAAVLEVAPPPPSPQLPPPPPSPIPPPERAPLRTGHFAKALSPGFETPPRRSSPKELPSSTAVAEREKDAEVLFHGDHMSQALMNQIVNFAKDLRTPREWSGVFMFLLMSMVYRVRVFMWHDMRREDILKR